jgi:hypothetical protein
MCWVTQRAAKTRPSQSRDIMPKLTHPFFLSTAASQFTFIIPRGTGACHNTGCDACVDPRISVPSSFTHLKSLWASLSLQKKKGFLDGFKLSRNRKKKQSGKRSRRFKTVQDNGSIKVFADGFSKTVRKKITDGSGKTVRKKLRTVWAQTVCKWPKPSAIDMGRIPNNSGRFGPKSSRIIIIFLKKFIFKKKKKNPNTTFSIHFQNFKFKSKFKSKSISKFKQLTT